MRKQSLILAVALALSGIVTPYAYPGSDNHGHGKVEKITATEGPNGGRLLHDDGFTLEVSIFETGIPSEMRLYAYGDGKPLAPGDWQAEVTLNRLGGDVDHVQFNPELDYQVGNAAIKEPHSYDVTVDVNHNGQRYAWRYENHDGRTEISDRQLALADVQVSQAGEATLIFEDTLFGVVAAPEQNVYRIHAPYPGLIKSVHVIVGEQVKKGQRLITLTNTETLQQYSIDSPASGEVTQRLVNQGDHTSAGILLEIADLSMVWIEMSAFPENIEKLVIGQLVTVNDLHQHDSAKGAIAYIAPQMTGGHIARTRAVISNPEGHWRPGMHVKADIEVEKKSVPLAIKASALQSFRDMPVVFAKFGNTFEVRMVELGESDGNMIEVLDGLKPGTEYVTNNSFLIKADVLKDGASHDH